jgi:hypothetical protein
MIYYIYNILYVINFLYVIPNTLKIKKIKILRIIIYNIIIMKIIVILCMIVVVVLVCILTRVPEGFALYRHSQPNEDCMCKIQQVSDIIYDSDINIELNIRSKPENINIIRDWLETKGQSTTNIDGTSMLVWQILRDNIKTSSYADLRDPTAICLGANLCMCKDKPCRHNGYYNGNLVKTSDFFKKGNDDLVVNITSPFNSLVF